MGRRRSTAGQECGRLVTTRAPSEPDDADDAWARRPNLTWDAWNEIRNPEADTDLPSIPIGVQTPPEGPPGEPMDTFNQRVDPCWFSPADCPPPPECEKYISYAGIFSFCSFNQLPFGVDGDVAMWTRLDGLTSSGPAFNPAVDLWMRSHDGYSDKVSMVVQSLLGSFKPWPVHEHRWLPPWLPVEQLGLLDRVHALGGTPVVYLMGGVAKLAPWPSGAPHAEAAVDLGAAEPFVRGAGALASVVVEPARGIAGLELITYDAGTGLVRRLRDLGRGYEVVDEVDLGVTASKAALAVASNGFTVLAVSSSPWRFFRIDQGIAEPISVPGSWTGGIALWPDLSSVRVVGTMSGGSRPLALAVAKLTDRLTASVTTIDGVPARDGMWFGRGMKDGRELLLVGGGRQGTNAHSDVFSVDVTRGGAVTSIANDDAAGAAAVGSDAWLDGTYDAAGWRLRAVPRGSRNPDERRAGSYERVGGRRDAGWQPAGALAEDTLRPDVRFEHRLALHSSCEITGAAWYTPPGERRFNPGTAGDPLVCAQPAPANVHTAAVPRTVTAYALRGSDLWTSSSAGLERWRVGGTAPELVDAFDVQPYASAVAANGALVAAARGNTVALAVNDARLGWQATEPLSVCDEVVALYPAAQSVWVVGERHVSRVALTDAGPRVASTFELVAREGSIYARPLAGPACGGAEAPEPVLAASASGNVLALALRRTVVTLDLEYPSRLPTFGAQASGDDVTGITARAGFVYATTTRAPAGLIWRLGPRHPFVAVSATPAAASIDGRQYSARRAARLSGTVLTVAWW